MAQATAPVLDFTEGAEERRSGRRGDRGGGEPAGDAVCRGQEPGAAGHSGAAPGTRTLGAGAHRVDL